MDAGGYLYTWLPSLPWEALNDIAPWHTIGCDYEILKSSRMQNILVDLSFQRFSCHSCSHAAHGSLDRLLFSSLVVTCSAKQPSNTQNLAPLLGNLRQLCHGLCQGSEANLFLSLSLNIYGGDCGHKTAASVAWYPSPSTHHHFRDLCRAGAAPSAAAGAGAGAAASAAAGGASAAGAPEAWGGFALAYTVVKVAALQGRSQFDIG